MCCGDQLNSQAILRRLFLKVAVINTRKVMTVRRKFKVAASYNICLH